MERFFFLGSSLGFIDYPMQQCLLVGTEVWEDSRCVIVTVTQSCTLRNNTLALLQSVCSCEASRETGSLNLSSTGLFLLTLGEGHLEHFLGLETRDNVLEVDYDGEPNKEKPTN